MTRGRPWFTGEPAEGDIVAVSPVITAVIPITTGSSDVIVVGGGGAGAQFDVAILDLGRDHPQRRGAILGPGLHRGGGGGFERVADHGNGRSLKCGWIGADIERRAAKPSVPVDGQAFLLTERPARSSRWALAHIADNP